MLNGSMYKHYTCECSTARLGTTDLDHQSKPVLQHVVFSEHLHQLKALELFTVTRLRYILHVSGARGGGRFGARGGIDKGGRGGGRFGGRDGGRGRGGGRGGPRGGGRGGGRGGMKGGAKTIVEQHRHAGVFIARGKEDALVSKNMVPGMVFLSL